MRRILLILLLLATAFVTIGQTSSSRMEVLPADTSKSGPSVDRVWAVCATCGSPCGGIPTYLVIPGSWAAISPHYGEVPPVPAHTLSPTQCFTFVANNTSENINMGSVVTGIGCGYTVFNWSVYNASCVLVSSGTLANLTVNGLTCGANYTLCISFKNNCIVDSIGPYVYNSACVGLPITLLSFTVAYNADKTVHLEWTTASEINNRVFNLEKSYNGLNWQLFDMVLGAGNSNETRYYSAKDPEPYQGTSYYRFKQIDYDGNYGYSEIVPVTVEQSSQLEVFPNPAKNLITVRYHSEGAAGISIAVTNTIGQEVLSAYNDTRAGVNDIPMDVSGLAPGMYFLRVSDGGDVFYVKFVK